jgi:hypothetical protein
MSVWTTPITWSTGAVTAAQFNTEIRDHLNFLKGALDLITNSTTADAGDSTQLRINRAASTDAAFIAQVTGDAQGRWAVYASGAQEWGTGAATRDVRIIRGAAGRLELGTNATANAAVFRAVAESGQEGRIESLVSGDSAVRVRLLAAAAASGLYVGPGSSGPTKVVGERVTGYSAMTGSGNRSTVYDTSTMTLAQLAGRVKSLQDDLTTHGLIGT